MHSQQNVRRNFWQWHYSAKHTEFGACFWHAINGRSCFVLSDGQPSPTVNGSHPFGAVRSHPCKDHANREISKSRSDRLHRMSEPSLIELLSLVRNCSVAAKTTTAPRYVETGMGVSFKV